MFSFTLKCHEGLRSLSNSGLLLLGVGGAAACGRPRCVRIAFVRSSARTSHFILGAGLQEVCAIGWESPCYLGSPFRVVCSIGPLQCREANLCQVSSELEALYFPILYVVIFDRWEAYRVSRGSFQVTSRLQPVSFVAVTLGADGAVGGSGSSLTVMVTSFETLPPALSSTLTLTL